MSANDIKFNDNIILILCVNYYTDQDVQRFVAEVLDQKECAVRVAVVDNTPRGNNPPPFDWLCHDPRVLAYYPEKNLGYFGGAWWGLHQYLITHPLPKWIIVSNADIHFPDDYFFRKLEDYYQHDIPAVIGPDIIVEGKGLSSFGKYQNPYMISRPSKLIILFYKLFFKFSLAYVAYEILSALKHNLYNKLQKKRPAAWGQPLKVYAPFGAFIIFHQGFFLAGGTLEHGCLIFGEEFLVAEMARRLDLSILYDQRLKVTHRHHGVISFLKLKQRAIFVRDAWTHLGDSFFLGDS